MIAYSYIEKNIRGLNARYLKAKSISDANYFSKLAVLELCGWIEESLDEMILLASSKCVKDAKNSKYVLDKVNKIYGFEYDNHFKSLVTLLVGVVGLEKIESIIPPPIIISFKSELSALKVRRNSLAHTYTRGATVHYDAPSITLARLATLCVGIRAYDASLRTMI